MTARQIVEQMYHNDAFSQWLGIELLEIGEGSATVVMRIRTDMLNGFGIAHGGITYSLADSALAFASNSHGRHAVSIETSIAHTTALYANDVICAAATLDALGNRTGVYRVVVTRQTDNKTVALFKGVVYRKDKTW